MEAFGRYIVSVTAAAILCGVLKSILPGKGAVNALLQLITGIFLSFVVIRPLTQVSLRNLPMLSADYLTDAEAASAEGVILAGEAMADIIKSQAEAYILDKAHLLQAEVTVSITLSDGIPPVPIYASLTGTVSPYVKTRLTEILSSDLGIAKENQIWIS